MRVTKWLPVVLLAILLAGIGAGLLWTTLMMYDDEGYVQYSLRAFAASGGLYEKVFSQYGPFFYLWNWLLQAAGIEVTHTSARLLTLVYWLAAAGFSAAIVGRLTRSAVATAATLAGVFIHLWPMVSEPSHPGGLICALVGCVAWLGGHERFSVRTRAAWIGAIGAALVLTKINVGIFLLAGAGAWWLLSAGPLAARSWWRLAVTSLLVLLPLLVMQRLFAAEWVRLFALISVAAVVATVIALPTRHEHTVPLRALWWGGWAGLVVATGTAAFMLATGTSAAALLEGVVLGPLRHPTAYAAMVKWRPGAAILAILSVLVVVWLARQPAARRLPWVAGVRIFSATVYLLCWAGIFPLDMHAFALSYGLTALPWFVLPLRADDRTVGARGWLALVVVMQALHAFPVAGSQISWGTFLWLPLAALGTVDALAGLAARWPHLASGIRPLTVAAGVATLVAWNSLSYVRMVSVRLDDSDALGLPGAATLQLPPGFTSTARILSENSAAHADVLFSLPGMLSFHAWSGVPAPTTTNTTHWFTLLSADQQEAIRRRLAASPRACVIVQRNVYDFLRATHVATESPLTEWLHANFTPAFSLETYEFWVHKGRAIAALGTVRIRETERGESPRYRLDAILAQADLQGVTHATLAEFSGGPPPVRMRWDQHNARVRIVPLNSSGAPRGPAREAAWPFSATELVRVEVYTDDLPARFRPGISAVHFHDAAGRIVAEARFVD
jgi:hypothetical protein